MELQLLLNYTEILEKLINSSIDKLRVGIPGSKYKNRTDSLHGDLKMFMNLQKAGLFAGFVKNDGESNIYPIASWDLEKLYYVGVNLWNILYSLEGKLGTFIWMNSSVDSFYIPSELKNYFDQTLFPFIGHHLGSNKKMLILSPNENFHDPIFKHIKKISGKITNKTKLIEFDKFFYKTDVLDKSNDNDWYLFFYKNNNIFIIPQIKSVLDIRNMEELERFFKI